MCAQRRCGTRAGCSTSLRSACSTTSTDCWTAAVSWTSTRRCTRPPNTCCRESGPYLDRPGSHGESAPDLGGRRRARGCHGLRRVAGAAFRRGVDLHGRPDCRGVSSLEGSAYRAVHGLRRIMKDAAYRVLTGLIDALSATDVHTADRLRLASLSPAGRDEVIRLGGLALTDEAALRLSQPRERADAGLTNSACSSGTASRQAGGPGRTRGVSGSSRWRWWW